MQLTQLKLWAVLTACLCGTALLSIADAAEPKEKLKGVETGVLLKRPQNYWSVGITYKDTVLEANGRQISILDTTYYSVELEELGVAYASDQGLAQIEKNGLNRQYLLTGTVLHERKGLFKKTDHYYIIILEAVPTVVTDTADIAQGLDQLSLADDHPATQHMLDLFGSTQRDLINLAKEIGVPIEELFQKDSENSEEARDIVRRALRKIEVSQEIPSSEILSGFIFHMLSRKFSESAVERDKEPEPSKEDSGAPEREPIEDTVEMDLMAVPMEELVEEPAEIQKAPIIALDAPEPIPPQEPAAEPKPTPPEQPAPAPEAKKKSVKKEIAKPAEDPPAKIEPAPVLAKETTPDADPSEKQQKAEDPDPTVQIKKAESSPPASDDKPLRAPVLALDPALVNDKPAEKAVKPRKKAKLPIEPALPPSADNDIFAPVGR